MLIENVNENSNLLVLFLDKLNTSMNDILITEKLCDMSGISKIRVIKEYTKILDDILERNTEMQLKNIFMNIFVDNLEKVLTLLKIDEKEIEEFIENILNNTYASDYCIAIDLDADEILDFILKNASVVDNEIANIIRDNYKIFDTLMKLLVEGRSAEYLINKIMM